jgi:predicted aconitase
MIAGVESAAVEELKSLCAGIATYGGSALFHMHGVTPEAGAFPPPAETIRVTAEDLRAARRSLTDASSHAPDFVSLGCPHLSIREIARVAELLKGQRVSKEFWITTSRPVKLEADRLGYTGIIRESGAKIAVDTCCVVAPIRGRFRAMAIDSSKACYYARSKNGFQTVFLDFDAVVAEALNP